jgi:purine nucleosidase
MRKHIVITTVLVSVLVISNLGVAIREAIAIAEGDFPKLSEETRLVRLMPPDGKVRFVLDTDTFNEIDDQFALVYALLSQEKLDVEAIYAAPFAPTPLAPTPFHKDRSSGPADGMEESYEEILRVLEKMNIDPDGFVYRGSTSYLKDRDKPEESEAVRDLIERALGEEDGPLYVAVTGAITNIASAILIEPRIIHRIVVIWLGGQPFHWPSNRGMAYNLVQDMAASRVIFDCGVPLVHLPCFGVTSHLMTNMHEIEEYVQGRGAIGNYLCEIYRNFWSGRLTQKAQTWVMWDIAAIAWLVNSRCVPTEITHSPILTDQMTWSFDRRRHFIRNATYVWRDPIFQDFFTKLDAFAKE